MKSLREQIADKCIHFNGIMNDSCKVGVNYSSIREGKPYKFPCLKQGGECSKAQFLTKQEVDQAIKEIESMGDKSIAAYIKIKEHFSVTKNNQGKIPCECSGELNYTIASNGHVWAKCNKCGMHFNE